MRLTQAITKITEASMKSNPKTAVIQWWGQKEDQIYLDQITTLISKMGIEVKGNLYDRDALIQAFNPSDQSNNAYLKMNFEMLSQTDILMDFCRFSPPSLGEDIQNDSFKGFMRNLFSHMISPGKEFIQVRIPSEMSAEESGLSLTDYENLWFELTDIDYDALEQKCREQVAQYQGTQKLYITTGENCVLELELGERTWHVDHGNGDFPAGEVYIAPLETSANGRFFTPKLFWEGQWLTDVILTFKEGMVVDCNKEDVIELLRQIPGDSMRIAEFGLGTNTALTEMTGYALFDEKMADSCHIAVGMNAMFGGVNQSPVHFDFVSPTVRIERN